ncbi:MAG: guanylate kinase [Candidatus Omnitrophica bacterium]|nr:guanylate kinase [Candidatus Omnitrophota bacterium]
MSKKPNLFILSAPSGCGKTSIVNKVLQSLRGVSRSVSVTTRLPRGREKIRRDYYFVSETSFKNKAKKGDFLEWAKNFGYYYGTPKKAVYDKLKKGKDLILTIDVKGALQVRRKMSDCVMIFITPPSLEELLRRLRKRGTDKSKEISKRLRIAKKEISFSRKYDYIIINDKLEDAVRKLKSIIIAERCRIDKYWSG